MNQETRFEIPVDLLEEFKVKPRVVIRHPWIIGIPAPEILFKPELLEKVRKSGFDVMLVPRMPAR